MSNYRLGTTYPPTDIETVLSTTQLTGHREPRTRFYEAGQYLDRLNGYITAQGWPLSVWTFDILDQDMVDALRVICPGFDAVVYISTRAEDGNFYDYKARMIWPFKQMDRRQFNDIYTGLQFEFRHLEPTALTISKTESVTVGESVTGLTSDLIANVGDSVTVGETTGINLP